MKLRGKFTVYLSALLGLAAIFLVVPAASDSSWIKIIEEWVEEYNEAVEEAQADDDDDENEHGDDLPAGNMLVVLDDEAESYAGIETQTLTETLFFPEIKAQAKIVDVRELLAVRAEFNQARAALNVAKVAESSAKQELSRLEKLSQGAGSVAAKNVNYAEASWREARAKLQGLQFQLNDVKDQARQRWGETISSWVIDTSSKSLERLISQQDSLLLVSLPTEQTLPADVNVIRISRDGKRQEARKAYFVSAAMNSEQQIQGETYYFRTATGKLRSGMRVDVWISKTNEALTGVFIPDEALIWYAGQAWAYIELEEGKYQRRSLREHIDSEGGIFVQQGIDKGDALVMTGSQMLLSQEFRWQIQDEDDD
jgi:hypothetical protein